MEGWLQWRGGVELVYRMQKVKQQWGFVLGERILPTLDFGLLAFRDTVLA